MKSTFDLVKKSPNGLNYLFLLVIIALVIPLAPLTEFLLLNNNQTLIVKAATTGDPCTADVNDDSVVDTKDQQLVTANYGKSNSQYDTNGDGQINFADLLIVARNLGQRCVSNAQVNACSVDYNNDGQVSFADLLVFTKRHTDSGSAYDKRYDLNNDGTVNDADLTLFNTYYNQVCTTKVASVNPCASDYNNDGLVNFADLLLMSKKFNATGTAFEGRFDLNGDRAINDLDVTLFNTVYGQACATRVISLSDSVTSCNADFNKDGECRDIQKNK
jgi:hypothetical protein